MENANKFFQAGVVLNCSITHWSGVRSGWFLYSRVHSLMLFFNLPLYPSNPTEAPLP